MAVEDIFVPPGTAPPLPEPENRFTPEEKIHRRGILWVLIGVMVLVAGAGVFLAWRYRWSEPQLNNTSTVTPVNLNLLPEETVEELNTNSSLVNQAPTSPDEDQDGLTQEEELSFGTSDQDPDSDDDGLNDKEEIKIYKTNPNEPDTDGDTFLDGEEVRNLYNPNGPGKIFSLENIQI